VKIVGLHIEQARVSASIIEKGFRSTELKDSFNRSFNSEAELIAVLKERSRDWAGAKIVVSIPGERFSQRLLHFPFNDRKRLEKALPFELEDSVPYPLDDVVIDHLVVGEIAKDGKAKGETPVLGIMLPKNVLRQQLEVLVAGGLDPQAIVPSFIGLGAVARMVPTAGTVLLIVGNDLCLKNNETVIAFRSFSPASATGGAAHTLKALEIAHGVQVEKVLVLGREHPAGWADLGIALEQVVPEYNGRKVEEPASLGLALSGEINFRKDEYAYRLANEGTRKRKRTLIIAGALAALLAITNLGVKFTMVQSGYGKLDREIKGIYQQLFPQESMPGDPVRFLRDKLMNARKQFGVLGSGSSALDAMRAVTEGIPKEVRVTFSEFNLEGDRLKLQGDAPSFESVDKIRAELQKVPSFGEVTVLDTRMGVDSKVKFRLDIKIKQAT
jgi:type II secretion system protein L